MQWDNAAIVTNAGKSLLNQTFPLLTTTLNVQSVNSAQVIKKKKNSMLVILL